MKIIQSKRVTNWGTWSDFENCDPSFFVIGFNQRVQKPSEGTDNTALNELELTCNDRSLSRISGSSAVAGDWGTEKRCKAKQGVNSFQLRQQKSIQGDNTAANGLKLFCEDGSELSPGNDGQLGDWSEKISCPENFLICGLRVQIELPQSNQDNTALNNVDFNCCPKSETVYFDLYF